MMDEEIRVASRPPGERYEWWTANGAIAACPKCGRPGMNLFEERDMTPFSKGGKITWGPCCRLCAPPIVRKMVWGHFLAKDCVPPVGVLATVRSGTILTRDLLTYAGIWCGHKPEDMWAQSVSTAAGQACGFRDHNTPTAGEEPCYSRANETTRILAPAFLEAHRRPFRWGWKYHTCHWALPAWRELCPGGKWILTERDRGGFVRSWMRMSKSYSRDEFEYSWAKHKESIDRFRGDSDCLFLRYEDMVEFPKLTIARLEDFLNLEFPDDAYTYIDDRSRRKHEKEQAAARTAKSTTARNASVG
jgi:hypothetical protein